MAISNFESEIESNGFLCYTIKGYSMLPLLHQHKDVVIIRKPNGRCKKYDVVLYKMPSGKYILHRVIKVCTDDYVICGDNCIRREYGITDKNIIGVMSEYVKNDKTHSVNETAYQVYSHLVVDFYYIKVCILWIKLFIHKCLHKLKRLLNNEQ